MYFYSFAAIIFVGFVSVSAKLLVRWLTVRANARVQKSYLASLSSKYELENLYDEYGMADEEDRNPLVQYHDTVQ